MSLSRLKEFWIKNKSGIRELVESLVVAAFIAFCVIRPFIIEAYKIPTGSMRPTLLEGDIIFVNKFIYGAKVPFTKFRLPALSKPKRGDVIVFISPEDGKKNFIKRLIAFEGETVEIRNGTVYINGNPLVDSLFVNNPDGTMRYYYNRGRIALEGEKVLVPKNSYFVLGDNSSSSADSRFWGFVPFDNLRGKALLIWWPPNRIRIVK